jgi:DNA-binding transcriptional LysR family regulator
MDQYQINYFLAIVETGGFTKAAEQLFVSQPSLSAGIKKLEQELGVTLFDRIGRRAALTPAGRFFLEKARNIQSEYRSTLHELREFQKHPTLRVGAICTLRIAELSHLIHAFREQHPHVTVELWSSHFKEIQSWLNEGDIDIALSLLGDRDDPDTCEFLFHQRLRLAVPNSHPFSYKRRILLKELDDRPLIQRIKCEIVAPKEPKMFADAGIKPRVVYRADNEDWVISLVQAGLGMTIMPEWNNLPKVKYVDIANVSFSRTIGLQWIANQKSDLSEKFRIFATSLNWQFPA